MKYFSLILLIVCCCGQAPSPETVSQELMNLCSQKILEQIMSSPFDVDPLEVQAMLDDCLEQGGE